MGIFTQNQFSTKSVLVFGITLKQMYMTFSLVVYTQIFYTRKNILFCFELFTDIIHFQYFSFFFYEGQ